MGWHDLAIGLLAFFIVLNTITIGLRVYIRTKLTKGAFGWDDIALIFTHSLHYGLFDSDEKPWYDKPKGQLNHYGMGVVCLVISGTVKISVALVLYRLDTRPLIRAIIGFDIATCCVWTIATTLVFSLFCWQGDTYYGAIDRTTCNNTAAAIAAAMRLKTMFDPDPPPGHYARAYRVMIWSAVEHGLSIFASSVLALRPLIKLVPKGWTTLLGTIYRSGSAKSSGQGSSGHTPKKSNWSDPTDSPELGSVGNQNAISIRCEYKVDYCV
ncbi:hypothetical protein LA080_001395 [Diaporthe eres]|nr:hypothetical protein LA080_001395 [Diaporthe eres]